MMRVSIRGDSDRAPAYAAWAAEHGGLAVHFEAAEEIWCFVVDGRFGDRVLRSPLPHKFFAVTVNGVTLEITPLPHLPTDQVPTRSDLMTPDAGAAETNAALEALAKKLRAGTITPEAYDRTLAKILSEELEPRDADVELEYELRRNGE